MAAAPGTALTTLPEESPPPPAPLSDQNVNDAAWTTLMRNEATQGSVWFGLHPPAPPFLTHTQSH